MLEILARTHRGRICKYKTDEGTVRSPEIITSDRKSDMFLTLKPEGRVLNFMGTEVPLDEGLLTTASIERGGGIKGNYDKVSVVRLPVRDTDALPEECRLVVVPNAFELRKNLRELLNAVMKIRELAGFNRLVYMSGIADPSTLSILVYMGVDLFDDMLPIAAGLMGVKMFPEGEINTAEDFSRDNSKELERELEKVIVFTAAGRLRELVDQRSVSSPNSVALLRHLDSIGYEYQEETCPTVGKPFCCNTVQSLRRPDTERYRRTFAERYAKPDHKKVLLLLPCSARKPYHTSKSHKAFASAIHTAGHDVLVHEVILTSPLGLVPRELDVFYPANSYDIPVTGEWNCAEKEMIRGMLSSLIGQGYDEIVCHFPDYELIKDLAEMKFTVKDGNPTSFESLEFLDDTLRKVTEDMEFPDYVTERKEVMRSVLRFQFGPEAAEAILDENTFVTGRYPYWKIIREGSEKVQLGMLTPERGMVSLTLDGAEILAGLNVSAVTMTDFDLKGNLFAVGVVDADPSIRIGDEAVILRNGEVVGVGVAEMCGREMVQTGRGMAIRTRHKSK
ncbi:MAG: DUF5591 domain-containing protein [Candidatus Methanomethylophilaceae archaeon]